jgi:hypothetical protein
MLTNTISKLTIQLVLLGLTSLRNGNASTSFTSTIENNGALGSNPAYLYLSFSGDCTHNDLDRWNAQDG